MCVLCLEVMEKWWQVRVNSVRRSMKHDVETEEKPQRRSSWDPKVRRERERENMFAEANMSSLLHFSQTRQGVYNSVKSSGIVCSSHDCILEAK